MGKSKKIEFIARVSSESVFSGGVITLKTLSEVYSIHDFPETDYLVTLEPLPKIRCFNCGSIVTIRASNRDAANPRPYVKCESCGIQGPYADTEIEAFSQWRKLYRNVKGLGS